MGPVFIRGFDIIYGVQGRIPGDCMFTTACSGLAAVCPGAPGQGPARHSRSFFKTYAKAYGQVFKARVMMLMMVGGTLFWFSGNDYLPDIPVESFTVSFQFRPDRLDQFCRDYSIGCPVFGIAFPVLFH